MTYKHDVFLSYPHGFIEEWVNEYFLPLFTWHLEGSIGYRPEIFVDRNGISSGDTWPLRLGEALCYSRCLIAIWSPSYFKSDWCNLESLIMFQRERDNDFRTVQKPNGLVIPLNVSDGYYFPNYTKDIQYFDCRNYIYSGSGFKDSKRYIEFQQKIRDWVEDVALSIKLAPNWNRNWLTETEIQIPVISPPTVEPPVLE